MAPLDPVAAEAGRGTPVPTVAAAPAASSTRLPSCILRLLAIVLTLIAAIVMGAAKETITIDVNDYTLQGKAKSTYSSSFVYFIVANTLVCVYSAVCAGVSFLKQSNFALELPIALGDLVAVVFLFTGNAAAAAVEIVAQKGNGHFGWDKVCRYAEKFCDHLSAAIVLSTFAGVAYLLLLVLTMVALHKRSRWM
ncbi:hypothetical protein HPP92_011825 [Vanilla planifolia]|uniref:CASP-like protein n=1 Tax=Vanilla planifolia TaxID=51239 RepID=A0A835V0J5_VANPL|nr:hypothetical protein HPP92_011825 [Vanilla planifolia]